ncbi:hypothetical protein [Streptomyces sp. NPDC045470]|uniref:hypothetical protein n=1 Tax=Streptomyces sp. NPDC045470 TaxID=3155469 RepID=UPI0033D6256D
MALTVSAAVLFTILTLVLLRARYVGPGAAIVVFLCGFFAAGTGAYRPIHNLCETVASALANLAG